MRPYVHDRYFAAVAMVAHVGLAVALFGTPEAAWAGERYALYFGVLPRPLWGLISAGVVALFVAGVRVGWATRAGFALSGALWATGAAAFTLAWLGGESGAALGTVAMWLLAAFLLLCSSLPRSP